ncbi:MAG: PstS family phosphate ABC transporter substrate-binding protein [Anaerolineae bacterium]|nr:PstS family phosphate ABC transporter substrate-binding protein [Anaerolineae bacterium]
MRFKVLVVLFALALAVTACAQPAATPAPTTAPEPTAAPAATTAPEPTMAPEPTAAPAATTAPEPTSAPTEAPAASGGTLPEVNPLDVTGDIITAGSSTVFPLSEAVAEKFREEGYAGNITIDSIGTGAGFERFCKTGETDVANASRAIKDSEVENCAAIGRTPVEFRVGTDALAVVVNPENDWLSEGVTLEELAKLFSKDSTNWSDVNAAWPNEPIKRFSPGTDSGTFDYFIEAVMDPAFDKKGEEALLGAANLQLSEDDNVLVQGVAGDKYAIGYFGFAYFLENEDKLLDIAVEGVQPTEETVNAGEYKLARPLFIYSDAKVMQDKPQVASFINFYLTSVNDVIGGVGYFPAPADALDAAAQAFLDATK